MKTLSVKQPWSTLLFYGKDIENRSWRTNYRGELLIHVSSKPLITLTDAWNNGYLTRKIVEFIKNNNIEEFILNKYGFEQYCKGLPTSCILGKVTLIDCVRDSRSIWAEEDCWHWIIENPILFDKPIENIKGKLNLWEYYG